VAPNGDWTVDASALPDGDYTVAGERRGRFFEQTNDAVGRELLALAERLVTPGGRLVDAYCGAGFFAHHLSGRFEEVIGIEENEFAVAHARSRASENERYLAGDASLLLPEILAERPGSSLLLDPPAAGVAPRVIDAIVAGQPREVVYVSCNPATLARDLALLGRGYRLESVTPVDMFPQTAEIEVVARLARS